MKRRDKGITLIALIVTIIILLILAGVTINLVTGQNGIINRAKATKEITTSAQDLEKINMCIMASYDESGILNIEQLKANIKNELEVDATGDSFPLTVIKNGKTYIINEDGSVETNDDKQVAVRTSDFTSKNFEFTGSEEVFEVPDDGTYLLQAWGAQGGSYDSNHAGGYGGYSTGKIVLHKGDKIYINVGGTGSGNGTHMNQPGGYNGGGNAIPDSDYNTRQASGGGATSIALKSGLLNTLETYKNSIIMVAGGGGGSGANIAVGGAKLSGSGGGYKGGNGTPLQYNTSGYGIGGTQTEGGKPFWNQKYTGIGTFGKGCDGVYSGSGAGFYGGGATDGSAGGGSGYIGYRNLFDKQMVGYNVESTEDPLYKTLTTTEVSESPIENKAKMGNGYAIISYFSTDISSDGIYNNEEEKYSYTNNESEFIAPKTGTYLLQVWGASGGTSNNTHVGGYGGYSTGKIKLNKGDKLYINVGGAGSGNGYHQNQPGGYNGGGKAITDTDGNTRQASGGGATSIAFKSGLLNSLEQEINSIVIVAGGGGGAGMNSVVGGAKFSGSGGGYKGGNGSTLEYNDSGYGIGGTQTEGGTPFWNQQYKGIGTFGKGSDGMYAGAGGGFYGGGATDGSTGGGSGYIANSRLTDKHMAGYNVETSDETSTKTIITEEYTDNPTSDKAKVGDGYAIIKFIN